MINKPFINFKNMSDFEQYKLAADINNTTYYIGPYDEGVHTGTPDIQYHAIVFIENPNCIWTRGSLYKCSSSIDVIYDDEVIDDIKEDVYVKYVTQSLSETEQETARKNINALSGDALDWEYF